MKNIITFQLLLAGVALLNGAVANLSNEGAEKVSCDFPNGRKLSYLMITLSLVL